MKTLLLLSHPDLNNSSSQQFLMNSLPKDISITLHHLEKKYPTFEINIEQELELLTDNQRILFQFPLNWYSTPVMLKQWQDTVLTAIQNKKQLLAGKELGLILCIDQKQEEFQAGGIEQFTISELTKPFQAIANYFEMTYLVPFTVFQFSCLTETQKMTLFIHYQQYFSDVYTTDIISRANWLSDKLEQISLPITDSKRNKQLNDVLQLLNEHSETISELKEGIEGI